MSASKKLYENEKQYELDSEYDSMRCFGKVSRLIDAYYYMIQHTKSTDEMWEIVNKAKTAVSQLKQTYDIK